MTLGVTGVVWLPRTATVNSTSLMAGAGPTPLAVASGAWQTVAAAYTDASITVGRVMAVLAAGWEGDAADAAQTRLGGFLAWTQDAAAKAAQVAGLAASEATAYTTAAVTMPSLPEIATVKTAKTAAYSSGGALNGSAEALEVADRMLDVRAAAVMEAYEAVTTPLALKVSFDRPPRIVNDGGDGSSGDTISQSESYEESSIFGFGTRTSPAQAAAAAVGAALQNPGLAGAVGQAAGTAGSVAGSSVTTVASAASNIGSAAVSTLMGSGTSPATSQGFTTPGSGQGSAASGPVSTRAVSAGSIAGAGMGGSGSSGGVGGAGGSGKLGGPLAGSAGSAGAIVDRTVTAGPNSTGAFGGAPTDGAAAARGMNGGAPVGGTQSGADDDEHTTPGYLRQFEHFADGRTVAPSVIGADPTWNDR